jgi:hypothetical protein
MSRKPDAGYLMDPRGDAEVDAVEGRLAEEIGGLFPPVQPRAASRRRLHDDLLAMMRRGPTLRVAAPPEHRRWALVVGATVGSLVPLVGVAAYLVRSRSTGKAQHAASQ